MKTIVHLFTMTAGTIEDEKNLLLIHRQVYLELIFGLIESEASSGTDSLTG